MIITRSNSSSSSSSGSGSIDSIVSSVISSASGHSVVVASSIIWHHGRPRYLGVDPFVCYHKVFPFRRHPDILRTFGVM